MEALVVALGVIGLVGIVVIFVAAGPGRGRDVPGLRGLSRRLRRALPDDDFSPAYGVLSSPSGSRRAQRRIELAERRVAGLLRRLVRRRG